MFVVLTLLDGDVISSNDLLPAAAEDGTGAANIVAIQAAPLAWSIFLN